MVAREVDLEDIYLILCFMTSVLSPNATLIRMYMNCTYFCSFNPTGAQTVHLCIFLRADIPLFAPH